MYESAVNRQLDGSLAFSLRDFRVLYAFTIPQPQPTGGTRPLSTSNACRNAGHTGRDSPIASARKWSKGPRIATREASRLLQIASSGALAPTRVARTIPLAVSPSVGARDATRLSSTSYNPGRKKGKGRKGRNHFGGRGIGPGHRARACSRPADRRLGAKSWHFVWLVGHFIYPPLMDVRFRDQIRATTR